MTLNYRVLRTIDYYFYIISLISFILFLGLVLLTVVDMRRGFLLPSASYFKIGSPSLIIYFNLLHLVLLIVGFLGISLLYHYISKLEKKALYSRIYLKKVTRVLAVAILVLLVADLFIYRSVPAIRAIAAGKMGIGQVFKIESFDGWLQPLMATINYLALVWHATLLGIFIGALFILIVGQYLRKLTGSPGFLSHLAGSALALPHPFCSCCAAPIGAALYRTGTSLGATLAFTVSAPMLNITSLILAASLLPLEFALLRIIGGVFLGVLITYAVAILSSKWIVPGHQEKKSNKLSEYFSKVVNFYVNIFHFENILSSKVIDSPSLLLSSWLKTAWHLGRIIVPVLFLGSLLTSVIMTAFSSPTNNLVGILLASLTGTILMVPTWTEIPVAYTLLSQGLPGPAATILLTLPAVSIPCLLILGGAVANYRVAFMLGSFVFITGILAGLLFM